MFVLQVQSPDGSSRRFVTVARTFVIGSDTDCELSLPGTAARHVRVALDRDGYTIERLAKAGLKLGDREISEWRPGRPPWWITVAGYQIECLDVQPPRFEASFGPQSPVEAALVDSIVTGDIASRLVYADWLEERGELDRAEIVRGLVEGAPPDGKMLERLLPTNVRWRVRVIEPAIEACPRRDGCVGHWGNLERSARADLRRCATCFKLVLYCVDVPQAREHVAAGGAVVFDPLVVWRPEDLAHNPR